VSFLVPIPLSEGAPPTHFDVQSQLEGVTYTLNFRWDVRASAWFMKIYDEQGINLLVAEVKIVVSWVLAAYVIDRQPPGAFVAVDTSGAHSDPTDSDFGKRVELHYLTKAELGL